MDGVDRELVFILKKISSINENERIEAEKYILHALNNPIDLIMKLVSILMSDVNDDHLKMASAIQFKQVIKKTWNTGNIDEDFKSNCRNFLVKLVTHSSISYGSHIDDVAVFVSECDFPTNWGNLVKDIVTHLHRSIFSAYRVLNLSHLIFRKYRTQQKSQKLWEELKIILDTFTPSFLEAVTSFSSVVPFYLGTGGSIACGKADSSLTIPNFDHLILYLKTLSLSVSVFHDLIAQEMSDVILNELKRWFSFFYKIIHEPVIDFSIKNGNKNMISYELRIRTKAIKCLRLIVSNYPEDIKDYVQGFLQAICKLGLTLINNNTDEDKLMVAIINFITMVSSRVSTKSLLSNPETLALLFQNLILPNISISTFDQDNFIDDPMHFIDDHDSYRGSMKRESISNLLRELLIHIGTDVMVILKQMLQQMLVNSLREESKYVINEATIKDALRMDSVIFLLTCMGCKRKNEKSLCTEVFPNFEINSYFNNIIMPIIFMDVKGFHLIKAGALRFFFTFLYKLDVSKSSQEVFFRLLSHLQSPSVVVKSYACMIISEMLVDQKTTPENIPSDFKKNMIVLFSAVLPNSNYNRFECNLLVRLLYFFNVSIPFEYFGAINQTLLDKLANSNKLVAINPEYVRILFEAACVSLWISKSLGPEIFARYSVSFGEVSMKQFNQNDFNVISYSLQLFSLIILLHENGTLSKPFLNQLPVFVNQALWRHNNLCPAVVRIMGSYAVHLNSNSFPLSQGEFFKCLYQLTLFLMQEKGLYNFAFSIPRMIATNLPFQMVDKFLLQVLISSLIRILPNDDSNILKRDFLFYCIQLIPICGVQVFIDTMEESYSRFVSEILVVALKSDSMSIVYRKAALIISLYLVNHYVAKFTREQLENCTSSPSEIMVWKMLDFCLKASNLINIRVDTHQWEDEKDENQDSSFNKLTYAMVSKVNFCKYEIRMLSNVITSRKIQQFNIKELFIIILQNPILTGLIVKNIPHETLRACKHIFGLNL